MLLYGVIDAITEYKLNKLSHINKLHSLFPVINNLFLEKQENRVCSYYHKKIFEWLCSHSREQLLTQDEDELCDIF